MPRIKSLYTEEEIKMIMFLTGSILGSRENSARKITDSIYRKSNEYLKLNPREFLDLIDFYNSQLVGESSLRFKENICQE